MKTISLFSGAGGLDIGATMAGADVVCSIDHDSDSIETLKLNAAEGKGTFIKGDVTELSGKEILKLCGHKKGEIDFLIGGPPCQSFSKNNYWTKSGEESLRRKRARALAENKSTETIEQIALSK